jgi:ADP-ribosyl-[dinitrogen reductase] hydrolase
MKFECPVSSGSDRLSSLETNVMPNHDSNLENSVGNPAISRLDRFRGCLLGLAAGDAVGTAVEFMARGTFPAVVDMVGGGPFRLKAGEWTDDTSMALCLADSLLEKNGFDPSDQMDRYLRWYKEGYLSSNGRCFDIGNTIRQALLRYQQTHSPYSGETNEWSAGNGAAMRLAPVAMFYANRPLEAIQRAADSSRTTHGARESVDACRYLAGLLVGALNGVSKTELLSDRYSPAAGLFEKEPLAPAIDEVARGSFKVKSRDEIVGSGYVVRSLEAALWAFARSGSFAEGCLLAANLGDDADTTAAIYGALAGAFYGETGIPAAWRERLAKKDLIASFAQRLYDSSFGISAEG